MSMYSVNVIHTTHKKGNLMNGIIITLDLIQHYQ